MLPGLVQVKNGGTRSRLAARCRDEALRRGESVSLRHPETLPAAEKK